MKPPTNQNSNSEDRVRLAVEDLLLRPLHTADHQNIRPDEITITKIGLDYYLYELVKIVESERQRLLTEIKAKLPEKTKAKDFVLLSPTNREYLSSGYNQAILEVRAVLEGFREKI